MSVYVYIYVCMYMFNSGNLLASKKDYWFLPKNSDINLGTCFFFTNISLFTISTQRNLKKLNLAAFFVCFLKIQLWKEAKISWKSVPICYTSKLTVLFGGVKHFFQRLQKRISLQKCKNFMHIELNFPSYKSFLSQMANTSMTILSQDLFRMSLLIHQAALQLMGTFSSLLFFMKFV